MNASFFCQRNILKNIFYTKRQKKIKLILKVKCCINLSEQVCLNSPERYSLEPLDSPYRIRSGRGNAAIVTGKIALCTPPERTR